MRPYEDMPPVVLTSFGYMVADPEGDPAVVTRCTITHSLYCHADKAGSRAPCSHIRAVMRFVHLREEPAD